MTDNSPPDDTSRWTLAGARFETPDFLVDGMRQLFRDCYGDQVADSMEASMPPPFGTMSPDEVNRVVDRINGGGA